MFRFFYFLIVYLFLVSCSNVNKYENILTEDDMLAPVPVYQSYFFDANQNLFGICELGPIKIPVISKEGDTIDLLDFFKSGDALYFTTEKIVEVIPEPTTIEGETSEVPETREVEIKTVYYKQTGDSIIEVYTLPVRPIQGRKQLLNAEFSIVDNEYEGQDVSDLRNLYMESGIERFLLLNSYCYMEGVGLWFYVKYGREPVRPDEGLYFWPLTKPSVSRIKEKGELW